jgi:ParB family transcriptional regulator, chromosome partitioning protein
MARAFQSEAIRGNMAESLARRPAIAIGSGAAPAPGQFQGRAKLPGACVIEIERLVADPDQPRKTFPEDSIDQLAASFRQRGQLVPILVRWTPSIDRYTIVDGERRFRAAERAGLASLAAVDVTDKSPDDILEIQFVTNALREDVPAVEQARSWRRLMDAKGLSHRELAEQLGYDHATITRSLGLLNLPESIQAQVDAGEIRPQTGYELSRIDDPTEQAHLAEEAKAGRLKRDDLRQRVKESKPARAGGSKSRGASKGKPKLPTERTVKLDGGAKVVVTSRNGLDAVSLLAMLREAVAKVEAEQGEDQAAA